MAFDSLLRQDIIDPQVLKDVEKYGVKVVLESVYQHIVSRSIPIPAERTKSPLESKDVVEVMDLIKTVIEDYEARTKTSNDAKVELVYEEPDSEMELERISVDLTRRQPGAFGRGAPFESDVRNLRPILREEIDDEENPGYKRAVLGYTYDNILTLTCWARTNKQANARALWLETVMEDYGWFFGYSGVNRLMYWGRQKTITKQVSNNKIYGRPIDYFVKTEKIRSVSQKTLEDILIKLSIAPK